MWADSCISSERHLHAGANGFREVPALNVTQVAVVLQKIRRRLALLGRVLNAFLIVNIHVEIGSVLLGEGNTFVVNQRRVFYRGDPGANGVFDALRRVRVGFDAKPKVAGFVYGGLQLFGRELDRFRIVSMGEHGACGENLDVIGATMRKLTDSLPDFPGTVGLAK